MSMISTSFLAGLQVSLYFNVAGLALWVYDYCITLDVEMCWIWGGRWNATLILFTVARYLPFAGSILTVHSYPQTQLQTQLQSEIYVVASYVIHIFGIVAAEGLLVQRTYRFWNGSKRLLAWLLGFAAILIVLAIFVSAQEGSAMAVYPNPNSRKNAMVYGFLLLFEIVLLCLIICSSMTMAVYRKAMIYISCIISMTLVNIIVTIVAPIAYIYSLLTLQAVMHSVLASRLLFDFRQTEAEELQNAMHKPLMEDLHVYAISLVGRDSAGGASYVDLWNRGDKVV
ncbi:hypothetical protein SERLA73DRAFT_163395 [Serpula lacrymans var. lacrymans S7.3]|uniref:DUF6533 domain-containing protein n=2 Tax=Serpula lacrymans var. lacrymans TaxID=341189 RepID=F8QDC3_SERL3|nr:uncharacterized protein SERLADRAFT_418625 [Serpula lacrymans var. lacrymans S7.9]EGN93594.1 hypothetical protein SERLA73DRAFT_163395 [Serpula lacrymans var. lacrymans S7.3]EGO18965.1 hypothetical protein SERLADRAFT_418625 [Serpula lacrymans var. lacrymans S7.9]